MPEAGWGGLAPQFSALHLFDLIVGQSHACCFCAFGQMLFLLVKQCLFQSCMFSSAKRKVGFRFTVKHSVRECQRLRDTTVFVTCYFRCDGLFDCMAGGMAKGIGDHTSICLQGGDVAGFGGVGDDGAAESKKIAVVFVRQLYEKHEVGFPRPLLCFFDLACKAEGVVPTFCCFLGCPAVDSECLCVHGVSFFCLLGVGIRGGVGGVYSVGSLEWSR